MAAVEEVVPAGSEIISTANIMIFPLFSLIKPKKLHYSSERADSIDFTTASILPPRTRRYELIRTRIPFLGISVSGPRLRRQSRKRGSWRPPKLWAIRNLMDLLPGLEGAADTMIPVILRSFSDFMIVMDIIATRYSPIALATSVGLTRTHRPCSEEEGNEKVEKMDSCSCFVLV